MLVMKLSANFTINQTALNLKPIIFITNPLLQPIRIIPQPVFLIPFPWQDPSRPFICHHESENRAGNAEHDEDEHNDEVKPEKPFHVTARADESSQWDYHEENSDDDNGFVEKTFAFSYGFTAEPDASDEDGDREEEGYEVEDTE